MSSDKIYENRCWLQIKVTFVSLQITKPLVRRRMVRTLIIEASSTKCIISHFFLTFCTSGSQLCSFGSKSHQFPSEISQFSSSRPELPLIRWGTRLAKQVAMLNHLGCKKKDEQQRRTEWVMSLFFSWIGTKKSHRVTANSFLLARLGFCFSLSLSRLKSMHLFFFFCSLNYPSTFSMPTSLAGNGLAKRGSINWGAGEKPISTLMMTSSRWDGSGQQHYLSLSLSQPSK